MANKMNVYYVSIEGNTKHFVDKMSKLFKNVSPHRIDEQSDLIKFKWPFFCFVPTYVRGTQEDSKLHEKQPGENFGVHELEQTLTMNDELGYKDNYRHCLGLVGSGNKNFGIDLYCWTARRYHHKYGIPFIADFELRGTMEAENHINYLMVQHWNRYVPADKRVKAVRRSVINPRLKKLQKKYHHNE